MARAHFVGITVTEVGTNRSIEVSADTIDYRDTSKITVAVSINVRITTTTMARGNLLIIIGTEVIAVIGAITVSVHVGNTTATHTSITLVGIIVTVFMTGIPVVAIIVNIRNITATDTRSRLQTIRTGVDTVSNAIRIIIVIRDPTTTHSRGLLVGVSITFFITVGVVVLISVSVENVTTTDTGIEILIGIGRTRVDTIGVVVTILVRVWSTAATHTRKNLVRILPAWVITVRH
jgi:hypothetical protein